MQLALMVFSVSMILLSQSVAFSAQPTALSLPSALAKGGANYDILVSHGVGVPDHAHFPVFFPYMNGTYSLVGPRVFLTAAHVITGAQPCPENSSARKGLPFQFDQNKVLMGPHACDTLDASFDLSDLKSNPLPPGLAHDDWALVIVPQEFPVTSFLSLDFNQVKKGENLVIIGMGRTDGCENYAYGLGFIGRAGAFGVEEASTDGAWLQSLVPGQTTCVGDSGSPWLRVQDDGSVSVVGAHSSGLSAQEIPPHTCLSDGRCFSKESSWVGLFGGRPEVQKEIEKFARENGAEICGVNRVCGKVPLPVSMNELLHNNN